MTDSLTDATDVFGDDMPVWMDSRLVPPAIAPVQAYASAMLIDRSFRLAMDAFAADPEFLAVVAPDLYLTRGSLVSRFVLGVSQTRPYVAVVGARNKLRHSLHATGVL